MQPGSGAETAYLPQRRRCPRQPERHIHGTIQRYGGRQYGTRLLRLGSRRIQGAKAEVAVGLQRAHAQFLSQSEGLLVVGCGLLVFRRVTLRCDFAEEPQGVGFVASFLVRPGEFRARCAWMLASSSRPASRYALLSQTSRSAWSHM